MLSTEAATTACNFIKKEALEQVFSCECCEISKNIFFTEHLRATASVSSESCLLFWMPNTACSYKKMCIYKYRLSSQKNVLQIKLPNKNLKGLLFFVMFFLRGLIYKSRMKGRGCKAT